MEPIERHPRLGSVRQRLDQLFAAKTVTPQLLAGSLSEIGSLQARVRGAHLEAHLAQVEILTPEQNARYAQLRGYGASTAPSDHRGMQHKH
jgi:Spy/CpxP family protein refolding chaperone